ncbi:hypothetical protein AB0I81_09490 [Nonomuraea sp. NPDC050404]|uniref:hypothetical protein n=1 Tax=Nonomuraea sp. NPDC050404 TaxID=3155783 RepID=UPI0033D1C22A
MVVLLPGGFTFSLYKYLKPPESSPEASTVAASRSAEPTPEHSTEPTPERSAERTSEAEESSGNQDAPIDADQYGDWNFRMGDTAFKAKKVGGWTYDSCAPVDRNGVLARNNCERVVQLAYSAYRGHLTAVQVIMAFPTDQAAEAAADRLAKTSGQVKWRRDTMLDEYVYGRQRVGQTKRYVLLTLVTADKTAQAKAQRFHQYLHADHSGSFLFRGGMATG